MRLSRNSQVIPHQPKNGIQKRDDNNHQVKGAEDD